MKKIITVIGIIALTILTPMPAHAKLVGEFTSIEGRVDVTSLGQAARPANTGDQVQEKDIIRAKSGSKAEIIFSDGNVLRLAQNTRVEISEYVSNKQGRSAILKLFRGKIQNKVKKLFGMIFGKNENKFEVHTPTSVCGVRGTNFFTYHQRGISGSVFKEGTGYGYSLNRPNDVKEIQTGQAMLVTNPDQPPIVRPATAAELIKHEGDTASSKKPEKEGDEGETVESEGNTEGKGESDNESVDDEADKGDNEGDKGDKGETEDSSDEAIEKGDDGDSGNGDQGESGKGDGKDEGRGSEGGDQVPGDDGKGGHELRDNETGDHEPGDGGPGDRGPGDHEPGDGGLGDQGPGNYGPEDKGPGEYGPGNQGSGDYGPSDQGPGDMGPGDRGPGDYGPSDQGPGNYGPGDQDPGRYVQGNGEPGDYGPGPVNQAPGDYGAGSYVDTNYTQGDLPFFDAGTGDPGFYDPGIGDPVYFLEIADPATLDDGLKDLSVYIPPDINFEEPFVINCMKMNGDLIPGPFTVYYGQENLTFHDHYKLEMSGTYTWEPPFIHMSKGVRGRIEYGTGDLSEAYYAGFVGANWNDDTYMDVAHTVRGVSMMFYVAADGSAGILDGDIFGTYTDEGAWQATGYMVPNELVGSGIPYDFPEICPRELTLDTAAGFFDIAGGGTISMNWSHGLMASITGQDWGMWRMELGGTFTDNTSDNWVVEGSDFSVFPSDAIYRYYYAKGLKGTEGEIDGDIGGGWVDLADVTTGIFEGGIHGGYNPDDAAHNFFAISGGTWIETNKFLELASTSAGREILNGLYIPCFEVGRADLSGSSSTMSVNMNDVIFFANSTGGNPRVWATGHVSGTFSAAPSIDHTVNLMGNNLNVGFTVKKWDSDIWRARVNGTGSYTGSGSMSGFHISMDGGAAGTYCNIGGTLSGTGAGAVRTMSPP